MFDLIPVILILLSLSVIIVILVKKFPNLANIDLDQVPKEKQAQTKHLLIENKLQQKWQKIRNLFKPLEKWLVNFYNNLKDKILALEERHRQEKNILIKKKPEEARKRIEILMAEAKELEESDNLTEVEKKYIEVISLDENNISAYQALGEVYIREKNWQHAKETFEHVLKIISHERKFLSSEETAQVKESYLNLGLIHKALEKNKEALLNFQKVFTLEPNDPKVLDSLIEMSIILKNKTLAKKYLMGLKKVNPGNEKIKEFGRKVDKLSNG